MKLLIFLGNPGPQYEHTRHNAGFLIGDELAYRRDCPTWSLDKPSKSLITKTKLTITTKDGESSQTPVLLVKPQTYMNLSGQSVAYLLGYYKLTPADIIVIHDDIDLPTGTIRRKSGGSSGGQNGIKDIIQRIGTQDFARIKIGIDRPSHPEHDIADYVLSKFKNDELSDLPSRTDEVIEKLEMHGFAGLLR